MHLQEINAAKTTRKSSSRDDNINASHYQPLLSSFWTSLDDFSYIYGAKPALLLGRLSRIFTVAAFTDPGDCGGIAQILMRSGHLPKAVSVLLWQPPLA